MKEITMQYESTSAVYDQETKEPYMLVHLAPVLLSREDYKELVTKLSKEGTFTVQVKP